MHATDLETIAEIIHPRENDPVHLAISAQVYRYGAGTPVAIVWDVNIPKDRREFSGIVVTQLQYGQKAYRFRVTHSNESFTVFMLRHRATIKSTYFSD